MPTGTITAITPQTRDSRRVNIFVEGRFAFGLSLDALAREGLYVGQRLDEGAWARLETLVETERALNAALRLLAARPRSSAELRQRLRRKGFGAVATARVLERLRATGMLDDVAFSRYLIENRQRFRPRGPRALRAELRQKGLDRETIEAAMETYGGDADAEHARALAVARAALPRYAGAPDRATFDRRLGGLLQRRGFSLDTIRPILAILWRERNAPPRDP
ncbi:MAG: regulatory protein RecX [Oscillochloridaceae bacterium]|nr:recombination regulator RecX [Chloroflexaceae bacterium]MDW8389113.1 regulatory protein RecX [Oscillochloridaceae bacterium]